MRTLVLAMFLACAALAAVRPGTAGEGFDFGDMPPLPPPLLDDAPPPPPLTGAGSLAPPGSFSPLAPPPLGGTTTAAQPSSPLTPPPLVPPAGSDSVTPVTLPGAVNPPAPQQTAAAPGPMIPETPKPGKITGGRVNVRAGPNTQYESVAVLTTGSPVTVMARHNEWYKIVFPADQLASIHKNFVDAEISGEIPEAGLPGIVNQDNADVHAFYWDKSTAVGKLNKGDPVIIKQERGQWYRIAAPDTARAFVFAEYVRLDGGGEVAVDSAPAPVNPAVDLAAGKTDATGRLKLSDNDRRAAALKDAYFKRLQEAQKAQEEAERQQVSRLDAALDDLEMRLREVDREYSSQISYSVTGTTTGSVAWAPPDPAYGGYNGWVENIGRVGGMPASFRLTRDGEIRYYLKSTKYNLNDYANRRVWVNGNVELASGASANVLNVDQIRILSDLEIAEIMRQTEGTATIVADPYSQPAAYGEPGLTVIDPSSQPLTPTDPYANLYQTYQQTQEQYIQPSTQIMVPYPEMTAPPTDASQLPDIVGYGVQSMPAGTVFRTPTGEVDSDYYEAPVISEIGP